MKKTVGIALAIAAGLVLTACMTYSSSDYAGYEPPEREVYEAEDDTNYQPDIPEMPEPWSCVYSPTYDDDWHNDVSCSNGVESHRPHLREGDSYITESEMRAAAAEYEAELNAGGSSSSSSGVGSAVAEPETSLANGTTDMGPAYSYKSVGALVDAAVTAGYPCPVWEQTNQVGKALESGNCSDQDVFSIYNNANEVQSVIDGMLSSSADVTVLYGPNWIANVPPHLLEPLGESLGGIVFVSTD